MLERPTCLLSIIIFLPSVFAILSLLLPMQKEWIRNLILFSSSLCSLLLALFLWNIFDVKNSGFQFSEFHEWIPKWGIAYAIGVDSISLLMVLMTAIVAFIAFLSTSYNCHNHDHDHDHDHDHNHNHPLPAIKYASAFYALILFLQTALYGTFLATDLFLFYFFWEIALIPMLFIIGIWGGSKRLKVTIKFFIYTLFGSLFMLIAIIALVAIHKENTGVLSAQYNILKQGQLAAYFDGSSPMAALSSPQLWLFLAFTLAFIIKIPIVPFHTWQPDIYEESPLLGAIFISALLAKMGTYGLLRFSIGLFAEVSNYISPLMCILGIVSILYGALCAWSQISMKRVIAYSSISHAGYILVGLFTLNAIGMTGGLYQMFNHALLVTGMFLMASYLFERVHTDNIREMGGLAKIIPLHSLALFILLLSLIALPGTNSFVGEFSILVGTFNMNIRMAPLLAFFVALGGIFSALYAFRFYHLIMFGAIYKKEKHKEHREPFLAFDLKIKEVLVMGIIALFILGLGIYPDLFFAKTKISITTKVMR
ncbi:MAG: NADH-quinone oxidoreductase subunit M [Oligoflexia bacterium]|nr:NADH-quinone oxidoreductase subunit M [Oligoflexia bacterium]